MVSCVHQKISQNLQTAPRIRPSNGVVKFYNDINNNDDDASKIVRKYFGYLGRRFDHTPRSISMSLKYLQNSREELGGLVLTYPYITGSHLPKNSTEFIPILEHLATMHQDDGDCHGDIRLLNMIFNFDSGCLIDFDLSGKANDKHYPSNYNITIEDGIRHFEAKPNRIMKIEHDIYSLFECLKFFEPVSTDLEINSYWQQICNSKSITDAITNIQNVEIGCMLKLQSKLHLLYQISPVSTNIGTGSPPKKKKRKRKSGIKSPEYKRK